MRLLSLKDLCGHLARFLRFRGRQWLGNDDLILRITRYLVLWRDQIVSVGVQALEHVLRLVELLASLHLQLLPLLHHFLLQRLLV